MPEEALDDAWLFLSAMQVAAGCAEQMVGCRWSLREDALLGVVVEVLGWVEVGAVAGQVDDFQELGVLFDEGARLAAAVAGVAVDDQDQLAPAGGLKQSAQKVGEQVLREAAVEDAER